MTMQTGIQSRPGMTIAATNLPEVIVIEPRVFADERGYFLESYNAQTFAAHGIERTFVQDNHSHSRRGVLRGLHYQLDRPQGKLVRVISGEIFDVAVDLRRASPNFGRSTHAVLSAANHRMLWIPEGFAHGFLVTSEFADVVYKTTEYYVPECERTLRWNSPELSIPWPITTTPILSAKDSAGAVFGDAECYE